MLMYSVDKDLIFTTLLCFQLVYPCIKNVGAKNVGTRIILVTSCDAMVEAKKNDETLI